MISSEVLQSVGDWVSSNSNDSTMETGLRQQYPDIHFTFCSDDDVTTSNPVFEAETFNLYLIDSSNHCLNFTQDMELATGIVVAEIEPE